MCHGAAKKKKKKVKKLKKNTFEGKIKVK